MYVESLRMHKPIELKAEETRPEKEELYRTIFENTGTATVIFEEDATISMANAKFAQLAGYTRDEIEKKKKWTEFIVGEDLEMMKTRHRLRRIDPSATPESYEFRAIDRHGEIRNILLTIDTIPAGINVSHLYWILPETNGQRKRLDYTKKDIDPFLKTFRKVILKLIFPVTLPFSMILYADSLIPPKRN